MLVAVLVAVLVCVLLGVAIDLRPGVVGVDNERFRLVLFREGVVCLPFLVGLLGVVPRARHGLVLVGLILLDNLPAEAGPAAGDRDVFDSVVFLIVIRIVRRDAQRPDGNRRERGEGGRAVGSRRAGHRLHRRCVGRHVDPSGRLSLRRLLGGPGRLPGRLPLSVVVRLDLDTTR